MDGVVKRIEVAVTLREAYRIFLHKLNEWWPQEYTWSQKTLQEISIDAKKNGLCTEIGPFGFRCDWGRVIELEENKRIVLKWQISPKREPIPNPENASKIAIEFVYVANEITMIKFDHFDFQNHGDDAESYQQIMNGEMGWDYILGKYKNYCES